MTRHILLLCLLGNPFELNLGGHQRTVSEIINHFKDTPQLELTVITTNCSLKELTANHLCSNITIYEIPIKKQWLENQDLLYNNKDFLYKTIKNIYENTDYPLYEIIKMASYNGAKYCKVDNKKGQIKENFDADLVVFDENIDIKITIIGGKVVYSN